MPLIIEQFYKWDGKEAGLKLKMALNHKFVEC